MRAWLVGLVLLLSFGIAAAQGGQGGAGGGFGGGGGGGEFQVNGSEFSRQLFLSPGDKTEWEFESKANEAVLISVNSNVFDPAVTIVDVTGKKLAENDDIEPGDQMARLLFVVPQAGKYKALVTNYKGTAGGQFTLTAQRFSTFEIKVGETGTAPEDDPRAYARIRIPEKGSYVMTVRPPSSNGLTTYDPAGDAIKGFLTIDETRTFTRFRFTAKVPGDYLFRTYLLQSTHYRLTPVAKKEAKTGDTLPTVLTEDEVQDWTLHGKKGELVEVGFKGGSANLTFTMALNPVPGERLPYTVLNASYRQPARLKVAFIRDGDVLFTVRNTRGERESYELGVHPTGQPWPGGADLSANLDWFDSDVWTVEGKIGDVLTLQGRADTYFTGLSVMAPGGDLTNAWSTGLPPAATLTLEMRATGRYVIVATGTGKGPYRLHRQVTEPRRLGEAVSSGEIRGAPEVWRLRGEKGQDMAFLISSATLRWQVSITDGEGKTVASVTYGRGTNPDLLRFRVPETGEYLLTVSAVDESAGAYRIKRIDLDR